MIFSVEAWDPEYGTGGDIDALDPSTDAVRADIEVPLDQWTPITPPPQPVSGIVTFVDGVRRIDARVWVTDNGRVLPGTCASVAAGSVVCSSSRATVNTVAVQRAFFTPPTPGATSIATQFGTYEHVSIKSGLPEHLYLGIHEEMTRLETEIVPAPGRDDLVVFDGPLRGRVGERTVGLIKTQHVQYLDAAQQHAVTSLGAGQRSPLFSIGGRASWYLRLPGPRTHGWAGIVRCEAPLAMSENADAARDAVDLANVVTATLPRYASEPHKESRAPQNLYPITGLEQALRRRLGDQRLLQRALRKQSSQPE